MKHRKCYVSLALAVSLTLGIGTAVRAAGEGTGFSDVPPDAWYAEAVAYCGEHRLMGGVSDTAFAPEEPMTRAMLAAVLYRLEGSPAVEGGNGFTDTAEGAWYGDAVLWASQQGFISGYEDGRFGTGDPISREQLAAVLWRHAGSPAAKGTPSFRDSASVSPYAAAAVKWSETNGIMRPVSEGVFAPKSSAARAQVAEALMNCSLLREASSNDSPRVLVAYFSRYGNTEYDDDVDAVASASVTLEHGQRQGTTELAARMIAEQTGGMLHLIETEEAYPVDFEDVVSQNHREIAENARPALVSNVDVSAYDVIFVGYPVWASTAPTPVLSFLEGLDLSGKTIVPFCTHDGYGAGSSYSAVSQAGGGASIANGLAIEAADVPGAEQVIAEWLEDMAFLRHGAAEDARTAQEGTTIRIAVEGQELEGVLYDNSMARQFAAQLPQTVRMSNYGGRELYGGIDRAISAEGTGQLCFEDGDITYCPANNTVAIFYSQSDRSSLTMEVYPIGKVLSNLSPFPGLPGRVDVVFETIP